MVEIIKRLPVGALSQAKEADMSEIMEWRVIRPHDGDRWYNEGEIRKGTKHDLGHLSPKTLELIEPEKADDDQDVDKPQKHAGRGKAKTSVEFNKAEGAAQANKAETGQEAK